MNVLDQNRDPMTSCSTYNEFEKNGFVNDGLPVDEDVNKDIEKKRQQPNEGNAGNSGYNRAKHLSDDNAKHSQKPHISLNTTMTTDDDDDEQEDVSLDFSSSCLDCSQTSLTTGDSVQIGLISNNYYNNYKINPNLENKNNNQVVSSGSFSYSDSEGPEHGNVLVPRVTLGDVFDPMESDGSCVHDSIIGSFNQSSSFQQTSQQQLDNQQSQAVSLSSTGASNTHQQESGQPTIEDSSCSSYVDEHEHSVENDTNDDLYQSKTLSNASDEDDDDQCNDNRDNGRSEHSNNPRPSTSTIGQVVHETKSNTIANYSDEISSDEVIQSSSSSKQRVVAKSDSNAQNSPSDVSYSQSDSDNDCDNERIGRDDIRSVSHHSIPEHLKYIASIQSTVKQASDPSDDDDESMMLGQPLQNNKSSNVQEEVIQHVSSRSNLSSRSDHTANTTSGKSITSSFRKELMPHLEYLADVTKIVKKVDDIDEADFTEIHKKIIETQEGDKTRGNFSLTSLSVQSSYVRENEREIATDSEEKRVTWSSGDEGEETNENRLNTIGIRRSSHTSYNSQLELSFSNFSYISETEHDGGVVISGVEGSNHRRQSNGSRFDRNNRRASNQTTTSHLSYSTNSTTGTMDGEDNDNSTCISGIVSEVMRNVREEGIQRDSQERVKGGQIIVDHEDCRSTNSSETFFSAVQSMRDDQSVNSRSMRSQRSYHTCLYGWTPSDFIDEEKEKQDDNHCTTHGEELEVSDQPDAALSSTLSNIFNQKNLQTVVNFFSETITNVRNLTSALQPEVAPSETKKVNKDDQDDSNDVEDGSGGNVDYGYSDELVIPEGSEPFDPSEGIGDETEAAGSQSDSVSVSAGSLKSVSQASSSSTASGKSGADDNSSSESDSSSKSKLALSLCGCSCGRFLKVLVLLLLLGAAVGVPLYFFVFAQNGQDGSHENSNGDEIQRETVSTKAPTLAPTKIVSPNLPTLAPAKKGSEGNIFQPSRPRPSATPAPSFLPKTSSPWLTHNPTLKIEFEPSALSPSIAPSSNMEQNGVVKTLAPSNPRHGLDINPILPPVSLSKGKESKRTHRKLTGNPVRKSAPKKANIS